MAQEFTLRVRDIILRIPKGKVTTYGIIADFAGNHCGARQVGRILHSSSKKYNLPWHRVVNRNGEISSRNSTGFRQQQHLLEEEGVAFQNNGKINLDIFLWWPEI